MADRHTESDSSDGDPTDKLQFNRRHLLEATGAGILGSTMVSPAVGASGLNVDIRQIVRPDFPQVRVFASVREQDGTPVTGLSASDFALSEDGASQTIDSVTAPETDDRSNISVSLVIDRSGSMDGSKLSNAKAAAKEFVDNFQTDDEGLLIAFDDIVDIRQRWTREEQTLDSAIDQLQSGGSTQLWGATVEGVEQAAPRLGRSAVIVLTDGKDRTSDTVDAAISAAETNGVPVYTIGLGSSINATDLQRLANETGGDYYQTPNSSDLTRIYNEISQSIDSEYEIVYDTTNTATDGTVRTVTLTADAGGNTGSDSGTYEAPCAPLPEASFTFSPQNPVVGQEVSFDASASVPNGGSLVAHRWDFNNNGLVQANSETTTHTYTDPGNYEVRLTVEKTCGAIDVEVKEFEVVDSPFRVSIESVNDPVQAGGTLTVEARIENVSQQSQTEAVVLEDFSGENVDAAPIQLGGGDVTTVTLAWETKAGDAGTGTVTVSAAGASASEQVEIQNVDVLLHAATGGAEGVVPGGRELVGVQLTNLGSRPLRNFEFGIDTDSLPNGWRIVDSVEDDEYDRLDWDDSTATWEVDELADGETLYPSIVIEVSESASAGETEQITALYRSQSGSDPQVTANVNVNTVDRFDPTVHGFGFPNWAMGERPDHNGSTPSKSEIEDVVRDTIIPDLDGIGVPTAFGTETALANILYTLVNTGSATNGHCYGITYAADEYYHDPSAIPVSGVSTASEITDPNMTGRDAVGSDIDYYHNVQLLNTEPILAILLLKHAQGLINYDNVLEEIKDAIDDTGTAPIALGNDDGSSLHQVLAYDYDVNGDTTEVYLYDSSSPLDIDRDVFGPYSHWRWEVTAYGDTWDEHRELSLTFDTSGSSTELDGPYRTYTNALYLHDGNRIDDPLLALGTLIGGSLVAAIADILSGIISFGISVISDTVGGILATGEGNQQDPALKVEVVGPDGKTLQTLSEDATYSNIKYDDFYYAFGAQSGDYSVRVEANTDVEYTVETQGTIKDGGTINDSVTQTVSAGETQALSATVPEQPGSEGGIDQETGLPPNLVRFDQDGDGNIGRNDVLSAINAYYTDRSVGGAPVGRQDVIRVITAYYSG